MTAQTPNKLSPTVEKFILHWGEMGTRWGINRTMAQIHGLLYLSPAPLHAERISDLLSVARSNVSTSLRELQSWRLVKVVHVLGDRRDHFESGKDVWEVFRIIMEERKRREIDPTLELMRDLTSGMDRDAQLHSQERKALLGMKDFLETAAGFYEAVEKLPHAALIRFAKMGARIPQLIGWKEK